MESTTAESPLLFVILIRGEATVTDRTTEPRVTAARKNTTIVGATTVAR